MAISFADLLKKHPLGEMEPTEQELFLLQLGTVVDEGIKANSFNTAALKHCEERMNRYMSQAIRLTLENGRLREEVRVLRLYGNKDCTAMADAALQGDKT